MLEELLRALSTAIATSPAEQGETGLLLVEVCQFWEELLGVSLATYLSLSPPSSSPPFSSSSSTVEHNFSLTSQACNVLATIGAPVMAALKASDHMT